MFVWIGGGVFFFLLAPCVDWPWCLWCLAIKLIPGAVYVVQQSDKHGGTTGTSPLVAGRIVRRFLVTGFALPGEASDEIAQRRLKTLCLDLEERDSRMPREFNNEKFHSLSDSEVLETVITFWKVRRKSELSIHMVNYTCMYKEIQFTFKLQHTGTSSAAA